MQNNEILDYLKAVGKPVYFRTIANWFPGETEEAELFRRLRLLVEGGFVRRTECGKFEVVK
jgi:hypothetical protein